MAVDLYGLERLVLIIERREFAEIPEDMWDLARRVVASIEKGPRRTESPEEAARRMAKFIVGCPIGDGTGGEF